MIDLFRPYLPQEAIDEVNHTLKTRWLGQGPKVDLFEKEFESKFGVNHAVSLNSGTSALETAYDLIGLKEGDEVISTPLTCTATNLPLLDRGVKIIWADILESSLTLDHTDVLNKITDKTKAIVNVHLGGIESEIWHTSIPVVADAAQALGVFNGDYTCCSFQAIKHITTGDGGMIVCPNEETYKKAKLLRWFGIDREKKIKNNWQAYTQRQMTFDIEMIGYKRQMTDIAASMGLAGLKKYDEVISHRRNLFGIYKDKLKDFDGIKLVDGKNNTCWLCTVLVERRDDFAKMMFESNIDTNLVQIRNDLFKIFGGERADLPVMNAVEGKYISLPIGMHITETDVNYICSVIKAGW
jgi:dTDP-4-amino-4,6-dideoxygalactose transaminase